MMRTILIYGLISGVITSLGLIATFFLPGAHSSVWLGYLIMLVALSSILVGVKQYRDQRLGGVIKFLPALGLGLGIALMAGVAYVLMWEGYMFLTHYTFMDEYTAHILATKRAAGVTGGAYQKVVGEMDAMRVSYRNPLYRMALTFAEIVPVGLLIAIVSAVLLRFPRFLPARSRAAVG